MSSGKYLPSNKKDYSPYELACDEYDIILKSTSITDSKKH
jgi:hypothetical protein